MDKERSLGYKLAWAGFILGTIASALILVGSNLSGMILIMMLGLSSDTGYNTPYPFWPSLASSRNLWIVIMILALLIILWGTYRVLKAKDKSVWALVIIAPASVCAEIIASVVVFYLLYTGIIAVGVFSLIFACLGHSC